MMMENNTMYNWLKTIECLAAQHERIFSRNGKHCKHFDLHGTQQINYGGFLSPEQEVVFEGGFYQKID